MEAVHKFILPAIDDILHVRMPQYAQILHVGEQRGAICLWARVDIRAPLITRRIRLAGTGYDLSTEQHLHVGPHLGTILMDEGSLVWHLFDMGEL